MFRSSQTNGLIATSVLPLALLTATACGPRLPADAVAAYDGGAVTAAEARRHLASIDARRLRTGAEIDDASGVEELLAELAFLEILAADGSDERAEQPVLHLDSRARLLVRYYIERTGKRDHEITDEEALGYFQKHLADRFTVPESIKFRHVFLRADRHPPAELGRLEREVLDRLGAGTQFADVVMELSESGSAAEGGVVGPVYRGRMDAAFEEQAYRLETGKVGVVRMPQGVHVVEVLERRPSGVESFEKMKRQIVGAIMDQRNASERSKLMDTLRERYQVLDRTAEQGLGPDEVVLRVKERSLTRRQLDTYLLRRLSVPGLIDRADASGRQPELVDELLMANLLYLDAVEMGLDLEEAFDDRWQESELRRRSRIGRERQLDSWARSVSEDEVLAYYRENPSRFAVPQRFEVSYLVAPLGARPAFELQQELEEVAQLAAAPEPDRGELERRCAEVGVFLVDMGWATPGDAARIGPEFQRHLLAMDAPGATEVFRDQVGLFVILVQALEDRRPMTLPEDLDLIRARFVDLRHSDILAEIKQRLLAEKHFEVLSTTLFEPGDADS